MSTVFICAQGHTWQLPDGEAPGAGDARAVCPICGGAPHGTPSSAPSSNAPGDSQAHAATILQAAGPGMAGEDTRPPGPESAVVPRQGQADSADGPKSQAAVDLKTLPSIPGYELFEELGRGGMGMVLKARQTKLDRLVALKILPPETGADPAFAERFGREARALARLSHPHIVTVHDFGEAGGLSYIVMEFVAGVNLRQRLRAGRLPLTDVTAIMAQLCDALRYAHEEGIVHRDIKPENVLFDKQGRVRIADFGLAKLTARTSVDHTLTAAGQVMGTWNYMAPEQLDHPLAVDHRADIYALGVVLYELLTGELPRARFPLPSEKSAAIAAFDPVVLRALEREPDRRYQSIEEFRVALEAAARTPAGPSGGPLQSQPQAESTAARDVHKVAGEAVQLAGGPASQASQQSDASQEPDRPLLRPIGSLIVVVLCLVVWPAALLLAVPVLVWLRRTLRQPDGKALLKRRVARLEELIRALSRHTIGNTAAWAICVSILGLAASLQPFFPAAEVVVLGATGTLTSLAAVYPYSLVSGAVGAVVFGTVLLFHIALPAGVRVRFVRAALLIAGGAIVLTATLSEMDQTHVSAHISQGEDDTKIRGTYQDHGLGAPIPIAIKYTPGSRIVEIQAGASQASFVLPGTGPLAPESLLDRLKFSFRPAAFFPAAFGGCLILLGCVVIRTIVRDRSRHEAK